MLCLRYGYLDTQPSWIASLADDVPGTQIAVPTPMLTKAQIKEAAQCARSNLLNGLCEHRNAFTIGWCAAFVQWGRLHIVQRAGVS